MGWNTRIIYVHLNTGEIIEKKDINKYKIIKKIKDERTYNRTTGNGTRHITYGVEQDRQGKLFD